jgi:hypothetical protein
MNATQIPELDDYESKKKKGNGIAQFKNVFSSPANVTNISNGETLIQSMLREREGPMQKKFDDTGDTVIITVNDESRKLKRDFKCKRLVLLNHMRYFEQYLKDDKSGD